MIEQYPNPSPGQLAAWRQLWALLLTPSAGQEKSAEDRSTAQGGRCDGRKRGG